MEGNIINDSIYSKFARIYTTRVKLYNKKVDLEREIEEKLKEQQILKAILLQRENENLKLSKPLLKDFTFTLSKGSDTYFEVLELSFESSNKNTKEPLLNYKAKRVYLSYKENDRQKMVYICEIAGKHISITTEDGTQWKGQDLWKKFLEDFKQPLEFKTLEHFFGLTYKPVQNRIEKQKSCFM